MTNRADFGEVPKKHGVPGGLIMIIIRIERLVTARKRSFPEGIVFDRVCIFFLFVYMCGCRCSLGRNSLPITLIFLQVIGIRSLTAAIEIGENR